MTKANAFLEHSKHDKENFKKEELRDFLAETLEVLKKNDKTVDEIKWVGDTQGNICMSFEEFARQVEGYSYLPRGRCAFVVSEKGEIAYYGDGDTKMNRIPPDLAIVGEGWFLRRVIHIRMAEDEKPRKRGAVYNESPEFWEFVQFPERKTPYLVAGQNDVRICATDNVKQARNLVTLNTEPGKGDPEFVRFEDLERNQLRVKRTNAPKRRISSL